MSRFARYAFACATLVLLSGCGFIVVRGVRYAYDEYTKQEKAVDAALAQYRTLVLSAQPEKLAEMFASNGEMSHNNEAPVVGRVAILAFLISIKSIKVLEYELTATVTAVNGEIATQKGTYRKKVVTPGGQTTITRGSFEALWSRESGLRWVISRMRTASSDVAMGATNTSIEVTDISKPMPAPHVER